MPADRLERTRRRYDRVIDLGPMGCKVLDVGTPDNVALNAVFEKKPSTVSDCERLYDAARVRLGDTIVVRLPSAMVHVGGWPTNAEHS